MIAIKIAMSDIQFNKLRSIIYERSGIKFHDSKKYVLESRLGQRLTELNMDDFDQYMSFLTIGPYRDDEFQEMFNRITINETSFFRNEAQLDVLESQILPKMFESRKDVKRIRIWSAACSTGEEPYTLAMMVHRSLGVRLHDWHIEILGTDISEKALNIAQQGRYTNYAVRNTSPLIMKRYFSEDGAYYTLKDEIKSMVNFELHNLKDTFKARRHGQWDIIVCRNVMIYFDENMKQNTVLMFEHQLEKDGYLFIGHSESLHGLKTNFSAIPVPQAFAYTQVNV